MPSVLISFHFHFLSLESSLCISCSQGPWAGLGFPGETATQPRKGQPLAGATISTPACGCQRLSLCVCLSAVSPTGRLHAWASSCGLPSCVLCVDGPSSPVLLSLAWWGLARLHPLELGGLQSHSHHTTLGRCHLEVGVPYPEHVG